MKTKFFFTFLIAMNIFHGLSAQNQLLTADNSNGNQYFTSTNRGASFPEFTSYLKNHLIYPELAQKNGVEGVVVADVMVGRKGEVLSTELIAGIGFGCDEAVIEMLDTMPDWQPAIAQGVAVPQKVRLNIRYQLK